MQQEHPRLHVPFLTFHPCKTSEIMEAFANKTYKLTNKPEKKQPFNFFSVCSQEKSSSFLDQRHWTARAFKHSNCIFRINLRKISEKNCCLLRKVIVAYAHLRQGCMCVCVCAIKNVFNCKYIFYFVNNTATIEIPKMIKPKAPII